jgi:hypothetical protein
MKKYPIDVCLLCGNQMSWSSSPDYYWVCRKNGHFFTAEPTKYLNINYCFNIGKYQITTDGDLNFTEIVSLDNGKELVKINKKFLPEEIKILEDRIDKWILLQ